MFTLMAEPVMINTNASSANIAVNGDKNTRQITSVRLTEDFRKRGWNFRKKMGWGDTGWVECPYEFKNLSSACLKLPYKPSYTIFL